MRSRKYSFARGLLISLIVFGALIYGGMSLFRGVGTASSKAQTELVRSAVRRAAVTCYAVEGAYPSTLDYLKRHYGLVYDEENYFVFYNSFATNIMPEIRVTEKGASEYAP